MKLSRLRSHRRRPTSSPRRASSRQRWTTRWQPHAHPTSRRPSSRLPGAAVPKVTSLSHSRAPGGQGCKQHQTRVCGGLLTGSSARALLPAAPAAACQGASHRS